MTDSLAISGLAQANREAIIKHRDEIQFRGLIVGALLKDCRDKELWKVLGYESFAAFLGDPEITMKRSTAYNLILIYEVYQEKMGLPVERLKKIGTRKLQIILPMVQTDPDHWLSEAESLSKSDLINTVKEAQGKEPIQFRPDKTLPKGKNYGQYVKSCPCCVCGKSPVDSAHFPRTVGAGAGAWDVIPLCRECHGEQHNDGVNTFFERYGVKIFEWVYDKLHSWYGGTL